jgi:hypothetical protein
MNLRNDFTPVIATNALQRLPEYSETPENERDVWADIYTGSAQHVCMGQFRTANTRPTWGTVGEVEVVLTGIAGAVAEVVEFAITSLQEYLPIQCSNPTAARSPIIRHVEAPEPSALFQLKRMSGLNWDQIAKLMAVSRRAVHNWASGEAISSKNQERLGALAVAVQRIDRGNAEANRTFILQGEYKGRRVFDILDTLNHAEVEGLAATASPRPRRSWSKIDLPNTVVLGLEPRSESAVTQSSVSKVQTEMDAVPNLRKLNRRRRNVRWPKE